MAVNYNIPLQTQLEYMMQELQGPESATLDAFGSGTAISPQDYAEMFEQKYERSGGEGMGKRRQYALEIFRSIDEGTFENLPDNVQTAFNFFKGQGFTDAQAAGIVGNLQVESFPMINPQAYNPEGGGMGAYGIAQFRGPRLKGLLQYAGKQGENTMNGNAPFGMPLRATMKQDMPQQRGGMMGGIRGLLDYGAQVNPQTGLSRFETFAAALDPLIMPSMRGGEAIRARGAQRVQAGNLNKTIEWLKANGYEDVAAMVAQNPQAASSIMSNILQQKIQGPETKVVDDKLINIRTGEVIYEGDPEKLKTLDEKQVTIVRNLSNDLLKSYKIYDEVANGYGLIFNAIKNKTGVDDYVMSVAFAKILDPESVVRESEQAAVARSGGAIDSFLKDVQNFIAGTGTLPELVRNRIFSTAQQRAKFYFDKAQGEYDRAVRTANYAGIQQNVINDVIPKPTAMPSLPPIVTPDETPKTEDTRTQSAINNGVTLEEWNTMSNEDKKLFP